MTAAPVPTAEPFLPAERTIAELRAAAEGCQGCELYRRGTQTVFGEGSHNAAVMLVGEQPGDREDLEGRPFVGPSGRLLDRALSDADIGRDELYVTNAVKHFKWEERGKRRIHKKPSTVEVKACHPWLEAELAAVRPDVVVALGATAAQALLGPKFRLTAHRREWMEWDRQPLVAATVHPSSILRMQEPDRTSAYEEFVGDLKFVAQALPVGHR